MAKPVQSLPQQINHQSHPINTQEIAELDIEMSMIFNSIGSDSVEEDQEADLMSEHPPVQVEQPEYPVYVTSET